MEKKVEIKLLRACILFSSPLPSIPKGGGRFLLATDPLHGSWGSGGCNHRVVVWRWDLGLSVWKSEGKLSDEGGEDGSELDVGKLLADASVAAGSEGEVWRGGTLGDYAKAEINLFTLVLGGAALPAEGVKLEGVGEVLGVDGGAAGGGEDVVAFGDDDVGVGEAHGGLDFAHDGVEWGVEAECLLDDKVEDGEFRELFVGEFGELLAENALLLLVELFHEIGLFSQVEDSPGGGGHGSVLSSHEEGNHNVGNFLVGESAAILVGAVHQVPDHVVFVLGVGVGAALLNEIHVGAGNLLVGTISGKVVWEWEPWEHEVDWNESVVEIMVEIGKGTVKSVTDFLSLQSARGGEDCDFWNDLEERNGARLASKILVGVEVGLDLVDNERDVGLEGIDGKTKLDKL